MAMLQKRGETYRVLFRYLGKQYALPLGRLDKKIAQARPGEVEGVLARLSAGYLTLPDGVGIVEFVRHNGKLPAPPPPPPAAPQRFTLGELRDKYLAAHTGSLEANTLSGIKTHFKHFVGSWGERFELTGLKAADLQQHADRRRDEPARGNRPKAGPVTIRRDLVALRAAWNWAAASGLVTGSFPKLKAVRLGKAEEKLPFMTVDEVQERLRLGGDPEVLWECLYLRPDEVADLLAHVRGLSLSPPWLYPMVATAAHTGARRSELLRAEAADLDLAAGELTLRERKRRKGAKTSRRVPLSPLLAGVLRDWLVARPADTRFLFAQAGVLPNSRVRGKGKRTTTAAVTKDVATNHLERALAAGERWKNLRGWHVLRHSFISACANKGLDQRMIDAWVGHSTEEQRVRYRHLYPSTQKAAIASVFS